MCYSAMVRRDLKSLDWKFGHHWIRESFPEYEQRLQLNPKRFPELTARIFPGSYTPIIHQDTNGLLTMTPMRYSAYPPNSIADDGKYTTFNARRDNLQSDFWAQAFKKNHGFIVLSAFFEWVSVADLLRAGVVKMADVEREFQEQADARKAKIIARGKPYKPTATEQKDPRFRKIIISFQPNQASGILVPVIYSSRILEDGLLDHGFAILTDEPPPEIEAAGHDRCPIFLTEEAIAKWLRPQDQDFHGLNSILDERPRLVFRHGLPIAA